MVQHRHRAADWRGRKNVEGVGEMSEAQAHSAYLSADGEARNFSALCSLIRPTSGRTTGCSNLGLANALYSRSDPFPSSRDHVVTAGAMKRVSRRSPRQEIEDSEATP